ncbi:MAG: DUF3179 domain-containing protein [Deltaproteobacteria bacterium]|nr:DUF3179 domain-containing protein [Deltaproteobacteria bacterium]
MYDRRIAGKELTFGVSGKLHANSLVMYDHQTESLWSHLAGAAVSGPLKGAKLKPMQSIFTPWGHWRKLYPDTKVLNSGRSGFFGSLRDPYESYYRSPDTGIIPTRVQDNRIYPKEYVLGLVIDGKAKAYPYSALSREAAVNDAFQSVPLLVVFDGESATAVAFKRTLDGKTLSFKKGPRSDRMGVALVDSATGSVWEGLTGRAIGGSLQGKQLQLQPATPSFWFGWVDHYPQTELYLTRK